MNKSLQCECGPLSTSLECHTPKRSFSRVLLFFNLDHFQAFEIISLMSLVALLPIIGHSILVSRHKNTLVGSFGSYFSFGKLSNVTLLVFGSRGRARCRWRRVAVGVAGRGRVSVANVFA